MKETELKIAMLGVSHWHVPLYLPGLPEGTVKGVYDPRQDIADDFAKRLNCPAYTDYKEMIEAIEPDFVFAFAPHNEMPEVAEYLIGKGIGFSMEKPMGLNTADVEKIYKLAKENHVFVSIPFVWRYSDTVQKLKEEYLKTKILHMSYKFIAGPPSRYLKTSKWMLSNATAGGGCMTNLGVHFIDMALYLTDSADADTVSSIYHWASEYDIETYASSMLRMESGASLLLESGYAYPMSEGLQRENRWTIVTENGYYILAENKLELREFGKNPQFIDLNTDSDVYYPIYTRTTLSDFVNGVKPRASLDEMLVVRRILDEMNEKAR